MTTRTPLLLLNSLKGKGYERLEAFRKLSEQTIIGEDAIAVVIEQLSKGRGFPTASLARFVINANSKELYALTKGRLFTDPWALLELLKAQIDDPLIEIRLVEELSSIYQRNDDPLRRHIVETLRDHGSINAVPLLQNIMVSLLPSRDVKELLAKAMACIDQPHLDDLLHRTEMRSLQEFLTLVDSAVVDVQKRHGATKLREPEEDNAESDDEASTDQPEETERVSPGDPLIESTLQRRDKAWKCLGDDNEAALNHARKTVEAVCKHVYRIQGRESNNKSAKDLAKNFDQLINTLEKNKDLPDLVALAVRNIQWHGNFGSHDQDEESGQLTDKHVLPVLMQLNNVVTWFKEFRMLQNQEQSDAGNGYAKTRNQ